MSGARILVVDDEPSNRRLLRDVLEPLGYEVREAADGEEALEAMARERPDLVLLDVRMPRLDGHRLCRILKDDPRTRLIPVVMVTSLDELTDKLKAVDLGADDYLIKPFNVLELVARVRSLLALKRFTDELEHASNVLEAVAEAVERRDRCTGNHCKRLGEYGARVGEAMGLGADDIKTLRLGGAFHDLGKIVVPDAILNKPGKLTPDEWTVMRSHPAVGAELCREMKTMGKVLPLIRHHHEKLDGSGYPDGFRRDQIPILVRIISVVDVYDALATKRSYKDSLPRERCLAILREEVQRGWWDPGVVETLAKVVGRSDAPGP